jgi:uncharacterized protein involved in exopolysaccharide biosynthesis
MVVRKESELSLVDIWRELFQRKMFIFIFTGVFCILGVVVALIIPNQYTAKIVAVPMSEEQGGLASLAQGMGGLASLAGIGFNGAGGVDKATIAVEIMKSPSFIYEFVKKHGLMVKLMASVASKSDSYELIYDDDIYDSEKNIWLREASFFKTSEPTVEEVHRKFSSILNVEKNDKTGFVNISIQFYSPVLAKSWVELLLHDINENIRASDIEEAQLGIDFLRESLLNMANIDMKATFYQLIEEQTKTLMLAESKKEYVFKTISPAILPEKKSSMSRAIICIAFFLGGGILSVALILLRYFYRVE